MSKKSTLLLFALFVIGQTCSAQMLQANKAMTSEMTPVNSPMLQAPAATASSQMYWVTATDSYDAETGAYAPNTCCYIMDLTISGNDVAFDGLVPASQWYPYETQNTIHGTYDADAKTVTIQTKPFSSSDIEGITELGTINMWGSEAHVALVTGNFSAEPDEWGQYALVQQEQLVFDVNDDLTSLTSRTGFGGYSYMVYTSGATGYGFTRHMASCEMSQIIDTPELILGPETLVIEGLNVVAGSQITRQIKLFNKGRNATNVTCTSTSDEIFADYDSHMDGLSGQYVTLTFSPSAEGDFSAELTFTADNGSTVTCTVLATVAPAPDFSAVVTKGNIDFAIDGDFPFYITSDLTGFPVAVDGVTDTDGSSELYAYVTVPEGETGVFSWKGQCTAAYSMGGLITVDGNVILDNKYSYMQTWEKEDISNTVVLGSGRHTILFAYENNATWRLEYAPFPMNLYVYDLSFQTVANTENAAIQKDDSKDYGRHYLSTLAVKDIQTVRLLNLGTAPLSVTDIQGDGAFSGVLDGAVAEYGEDLEVPILFTANEVGSYQGNVVVNTTAGSFTIKCEATAEAIPVDYSPIVTEGNIGFNTSFEYPFLVEGNTAKSSTAGNETLPCDSWIELLFDVPANQTGVISWTGLTSSVGIWDFMGQSIYTDYTQVTFDNVENEQKFAGANINTDSSNFDESELTFTEGRHVIRFNYHKVDSYPEGDDCFYLSDVKLVLSGGEDGINSIAQDQSSVIYDLSGRRLNGMATSGLYIQNGQKMIVK